MVLINGTQVILRCEMSTRNRLWSVVCAWNCNAEENTFRHTDAQLILNIASTQTHFRLHNGHLTGIEKNTAAGTEREYALSGIKNNIVAGLQAKDGCVHLNAF